MELLAREKELTRQTDALNADRRRLPMVRIDEDYVFTGPDGRGGAGRPVRGAPAADRPALHVRSRVGGRLLQLLGGCRRDGERAAGSSARARHDVCGRVAGAVREARGLPQAQGLGVSRGTPRTAAGFNYDFHATIDESVAPLEINYRTRGDIERPEGAAIAWAATADQPFKGSSESHDLTRVAQADTPREKRPAVLRQRVEHGMNKDWRWPPMPPNSKMSASAQKEVALPGKEEPQAREVDLPIVDLGGPGIPC